MLHVFQQTLHIAGTELLAGQIARYGRQFEYCAQHSGHKPVAEQYLIVEYEILEITPFRRHEHYPMRRVERGDGTVGARNQPEACARAGVDADAAAKADILVQIGDAPRRFAVSGWGGIPSVFRLMQRLDRAGFETLPTAHTGIGIQFDNEV